MFVPTVRHMDWNTSVLPVKCTPARSGCVSTSLETVTALPGTKLITPSGSPASRSRHMMCHDESTAAAAGFHTTVHPISAGDVGRFPQIAVKLKGVIAYTNP